MTNIAQSCRICGGLELHEFSDYPSLARVTSDCKAFPAGGRLMACLSCGAVQKPTDAAWQKEADGIYENYQPYFQSGGVEQAVFDAEIGRPRLRSNVIIDKLAAARGLGDEGALIDVGCGNGVMLKAFAQARPGWRLNGHELSDLHLAELKAIPGFDRFYTGSLEELPGGFDVITMMHALEHFVDPREGLVALRDKLSDTGCLFVEVPNAAVTPFDLLIADHVSHFTRHHLAMVAQRAGLGVQVVADDWVTKELSMIATRSGPVATLPPMPSAREAIERVQGQLDWLHAVVAGARRAIAGGGKFGIFGSSVAAMWLFGVVGDDVSFFVDEDPSRSGAEFLGRPILPPDAVEDGSVVYMTLITPVAKAVASRLQRPGVSYLMPAAA